MVNIENIAKTLDSTNIYIYSHLLAWVLMQQAEITLIGYT